MRNLLIKLCILVFGIFSSFYASAQIKYNLGGSFTGMFLTKDNLTDLHFNLDVKNSIVGVRWGFHDEKISQWYGGVYVGQIKTFDEHFSILGTVGSGYMRPFEEHQKSSLYAEAETAFRYTFAPPYIYFQIGYNFFYTYKDRPNYSGVKMTIGVSF